MMTTMAAYAECQKNPLYYWTYAEKVNSAKYIPSNNTIDVNISYVLTGTSYKRETLCGGYGNFDKWRSRHTVVIGGNESAPQYVTASSKMPGSLSFTVSANGLDIGALARGDYNITPSSYYIDGYTTAYVGNYNYYNPQSAPTSIIQNMSYLVRTDYENQNSYTCPAERPSGYYVQRRSYDVWSDGSVRNVSAWANIEDRCTAIFVRMGYDNGTQVCPSTQPSGVINIQQSYEVWSDGSIRNASGFKEISRTCAAIYVRTGYDNGTAACPATHPSGIITTKQSYDVWSDGSIRNVSGFKEVSRTCAAVYVRTDYDYGTQVCPAAQPSGIINTKQSYDVWSDGSIRNVSGFKETGRTCVAIKTETKTQSRDNTCPAGQTGKVTQTRTYDVWSDGSTKNYSAWTVSKNTCVANPLTPDTTKRVEMCLEGYTGKKTYKWEVYYTNDSYSIIDTDGTKIDYVLSTPHQREVLESNTCTLIPSNPDVSTTPGSITVTCDSFYGAAKGTYRGDVIKYGNYVTSYSSATKQTTTKFVLTNNNDVSSCVSDSEKTLDFEKRIVACEAGKTGQKVEIRYFAVDGKGNKTYIYGPDYNPLSNTCSELQLDQNTPPDTDAFKLSGLLSNNSLTTSSLTNETKLKNFIDALDKTTISTDTYRLNLIVDDLNSKKYNIENVSNTVATFQKATGQSVVKVFIPKAINQYVGRDSITASNTKNKIIVSTELLSNGNLKVQYKDLVQGNKTAELKSFNIKLFNSNVDMRKVSVQ